MRTNEIVRTAHNKRAAKWFYAEAIRFYAHDFMSQKGISARLVNEKDKQEEGEESVWNPKVLAGNGIAGNINGYEYRMLKVFNGGLPPAVSNKRKEFYNQSHLKAYQPPLIAGYVDRDDFRLKPNLGLSLGNNQGEAQSILRYSHALHDVRVNNAHSYPESHRGNRICNGGDN